MYVILASHPSKGNEIYCHVTIILNVMQYMDFYFPVIRCPSCTASPTCGTVQLVFLQHLLLGISRAWFLDTFLVSRIFISPIAQEILFRANNIHHYIWYY